MTASREVGDRPGLTGLRADPDDLRRELERVLAFATAHLRCYPAHHTWWVAHRKELTATPERWLVEAVDLAFHAARSGPPDRDVVDAAGSLAEVATPWVQHRGLADQLRRQPQTAMAGLGGAQLQLALLGHPCAVLDGAVRRALTTPPVELIERLPSKAMRQAWLRELIGEAGPEAAEALIADSVLGSAAHPLEMSRRDAYHLTHAVWFATDYGLRSLPEAVDADDLAALVDAALAWRLAAGDWDLLAELLMCSSALGLPWSPYARLGWAGLRQAWALGPATNPSEEWFWGNYHRVQVFGKLCALLRRHPADSPGERPWRAPKTPVPRVSHERPAAAHKAAPPAAPAWLARLAAGSGLSPSETDRVTADVELIDAVRSDDLGRLRRGLEHAFRTVSPPSPTAIRAAELLSDQVSRFGPAG